MSNFWKGLPKPFTVLAPMEDVTDVVFREIMAEGTRPDVFFTEFTSSDGLVSKGRDRVAKKLQYTEKQRPIVAQIWGGVPEKIHESAKFVRELGFDGLDINMGCPVPAVMRRDSGSGIIGNYRTAKEIIAAAVEGAGDMPVSVKTRLGINEVIIDDWIDFLLEQDIKALTIHGRIAVQMSKGEANWEQIGRAVRIRDVRAPDTRIIGNGDVTSYAHAMEMHDKYEVDGVMIGRGIFHNPWVFEKIPREHTKKEFIDMLIKHLTLYEETWGRSKNFEMMKKFFKMYVRDFDGANELRQELMERKNYAEMIEILTSN